MTATPTTVIQFNFKTPTGGLHNVYADNVPEAVELLEAFQSELVGAIFDVEQKIQAAYAVSATPVPPVQQAAATPPPVAAPAGEQAQHLCDHNQAMKFIKPGVSKSTGKPYKGFYVCAQPRVMQCDKTVQT